MPWQTCRQRSRRRGGARATSCSSAAAGCPLAGLRRADGLVQYHDWLPGAAAAALALLLSVVRYLISL